MRRASSRLSAVPESGARPYVAPTITSTGSLADPAQHLRLLEAEARERGRQAGYEEGGRLALEKLGARIEALGESIERLVPLRSEIVRQAEQDLLRLAIRIAETVVREKVASDSGPAVRALAAALAEIPKTDAFSIRCHPGEEPALAAWLGRPGGLPAAFTLRPDPSITPGGCIVESALGEIDVRVETQLRVIEHELLSRT